MAPLVSFIIPCYNYGRYLSECLAGIFGQQSYDDFEILAIDDCSTDNTRDLLLGCTDSRLRVIHHEENRGHIYSVNEGSGLAQGRFIARIDPDDRYRPNFLSTLLPRFENAPEVGMVYGDAAIINEVGEVTCPRCDDVHGGQDFRGNELLGLLRANYLCAPTAIARREAWLSVLPIWDGLAFNDWYLNVMIARRFDLCYVHEVVADYRVHPRNHHSLVVLDRSEEQSILRVLEHVFATPEKTPELETAKRQARGRIYAAQYLTLAEKYFGVGYYADARRCYRQTWRHQPGRMLRLGLLRRWLATYLGRERYESLKRIFRVFAPAPAAELTGTRRETES